MDRNVLTAEMMKDVDRKLPEIEADSKLKLMERLMPILWNAKDSGEDVDMAGWKWFMNLIEQTLGREKFVRLLNQYLREHGIELTVS